MNSASAAYAYAASPPPIPPLAAVEKELCERSLVDFTEQAWPLVEPRAPFVNSWHIGAIAEHLEAVTLGQLQGDILINIPPGTSKSYQVSVFWPAWEWGPRRRPDMRYLCGSYDEALSIRDNLRMRTIIESSWYQERWPIRLRDDQNTKTRFDNTATGWRIATSVGGRGTGEHPHRKIIDDPHNVKRAMSAAARREAINWIGLTMGTRGVALGAVTVVIMQRLHEEDLSGYILREMRDQFQTFICLPMRYEPPAFVDLGATAALAEGSIDGIWFADGRTDDGQRAVLRRMPTTPLGFQDPRTKPGELLMPALFDETKVAAVESTLRAAHGEFGVAGQMQQRPTPEKGGMFQEAWLPIIEAMPAEGLIVRRARGWDCAATAGAGDYSVGVRMALTKSGLIVVEDVRRGQWGADEFEGDLGIMKSVATEDGRAVAIREEQEPGSGGKKVIADHTKLFHGFAYTGKPSSGDKATRAKPFRNQCAAGNVRLLRGPWNREYIRELCAFPNGTFDDQLDASSSAYDEVTTEPPRKQTSAVWGR
jgi:predicted phage terminase large subunit-like protein